MHFKVEKTCRNTVKNPTGYNADFSQEFTIVRLVKF